MKLTAGNYFGSVRRGVQNERLSVLLTAYEPLQTQPWHTHEHPTLFLHLRGTHFDSLPDRRIDQPSLTVVYHPPTTAHRSEVGPEGMAGINIELKPAWFERFQADALALGGERLIGGSDVALQTIWLAVARDLSTRDLDFESLVFELLATGPSSESCSASAPRWLREAKERVEEASGIGGVAELARDLAVHPGHLAKSFRRRYGTTVESAIQSARLARASRLILRGMSAGEAALEAGFSDQFYLSRCLARRARVRPRELAALRRELASKD
jgi:AraC family transcriptional regulator